MRIAQETQLQSVLAAGMRITFMHSRYNSASHSVDNTHLYAARVLRGATEEEEEARVLLLEEAREYAEVGAAVPLARRQRGWD